MSSKILIVEDDSFLREGLEEILKKESYEVKSASTVKDALTYIEIASFDLYMLDVMLPDGNGIDICKKIRQKDNKTPILFLTSCDDENEVVAGLDAGADDYVTKPFGIKILLSRIRALLRRNISSTYEKDGLKIDLEKMTAYKDGEALLLTPTEFQILALLIKNSGVVVTRNQMLSVIWDIDGNFIDDNTLSVHISRLREKIGLNNLKTVRGIGYRWES